ncbi:hypothetical protein QFC20_004753 [Naganishia adeliensis]|uniref:Uncharacterized protein n=1 Tax=Naganishia adeliensis TaxID=92952 RepID=A0ACC2VW96_9TREE|nr:hypothetical protein QFC20_004753 [Naganishia adeliensis]
MHSHHSHSGQFCRHAAPNTTLEQSILAALARGLTTFGLSEHVPRYRAQDLYPEESDLTPEDLERAFDEYLAEAHRLKREYAGRIDLLVGAETDYITPLDLERLEALLERCEVEYVVGSVHHVNEQGIDFSENWWRTCVAGFEPSPSSDNDPKTTPPTTTPSDTALTAYFNTYLDAQHTLLTRIAPPIIGHFDLCRLYIPHTRTRRRPSIPGQVVAYGGLFEVNAAAFRKGWDAAYPGTEILQCIIAHRGRLCLSDDSHGPLAVAQNYPRLRDYLLGRGVTEIWYLASVPRGTSSSEDSPRETAGDAEEGGMANPRGLPWSWLSPSRRRVVPRRYEGDWAADGFWAALEAREAEGKMRR